MVAARVVPRPRAVAVALVAIMLLPAAVMLVPPAHASPPTALNVTVREIRVGGVAVTDPFLKRGESFDVVVTATADMQGCTVPAASNAPPRLDVKADLAAVGGSAAWVHAAAMTQVSSTTTWTGTVTLQNIVVNGTGTANGESRSIPLEVSARCHSTGGLSDEPMTTPTVTSTSNTFRPDSVLPTVTATIAPTSATDSTVGIGETFKLTFTGASSDVASHDINIDDFTAACGTPCNLQGGPPVNIASLALGDTGVEVPTGTVVLRDNAGNANTVPLAKSGIFDARRPTTPTITVAQGPDPKLVVGVTAGATDGDLSSFTVRVQPQGGTTVDLVCGCGTSPPAAGGTATYTLTNAVFTAQGKPAILQRGTTYEVSVGGVDDAANAGLFSAPAVARKIEYVPSATVLVDLLTGTGGIGSTFQLERTSSVDTTAIQADLSSLITTAQASNPAQVTFTATKSNVFTVEDTGDATGALGALAVAPDGSSAAATIQHETAGFTFDPKRPIAPTQFAVNALPGTQVKVKFVKVADATDYGVERRPFGAATWTVQVFSAGGPDVTCGGTGGNECQLTLPASHFVAGTKYEFRARARDAKDNWGPYTPIDSTTPSSSPLSVSFNTINPPYGQSIPVVGGQYSVSDSSVNPTTAIKVALVRKADGHFWNGANAFGATQTWLPVTAAAGGEWSAEAFENANPAAFGTDNYELRVRIEHPTGAVSSVVATKDFTVDQAGPTIDGTLSKFVSTGPFTVQSGVTQLAYRVKSQDTHVGVGTVELHLYRDAVPAFTHPAVDAQDVPVVITCVATTCRSSGAGTPVVGSLDTALSGQAYDGVATFTLDRVPVGSYQLRLKVFDLAGNPSAAHDETANADKMRVVPRLRLLADDVRMGASVVFPGPFVDSNGLRVSVLAAWDNHTALNPEGPCDLNACRVTAVEVWGRDRTGTGTNAGTLLQNIAFPSRGPNQFLAGVDGALGSDATYYYDYSPTNPIPVGTIPLDKLEIRVKAYVTMGAGSANVFTTWSHGTDATSAPGSWLRVPTTTTKPGLFFTYPADTTTVYLGGGEKRVFFNVTFEQPGLPPPANAAAVPKINYSVRVLNDPSSPANNGKYANFEPTTGTLLYSSTPPAVFVEADRGPGTNPPLPKGPKFYYNWSNNLPVPRGEYLINVTVSGPDVIHTFTSRYFAVETTPPLVKLSGPAAAQAEIFPATDSGRYVRPMFNVTARIEHNLANLSASGLSATLLATNAGGGTRVIRQNMEEFSWAVRDFSTLPGEAVSYANLTIRLPHNATDGTRYDLRVNASVESQPTGRLPGGSNFGNATGIRAIEVDRVPPGSGVFRDATNHTGFNPAGELVIKGFAEDRGSGVQAVEVRVHDLTNNRTLVWNLGGEANGGWMPGLVDSWLSSDPRQAFVSKKWARDVVLASPGGTVTEWSVRADVRPRYDDATLATPNGTWDRLPLDRNATYRVDVRARDQLGAFAEHQSFEVRFDNWAPAIASHLAIASGTGFVAWHDATTRLQVGVQDNQCLHNVTLYGRAPSGRMLGPFDFARPAGAQCGRTTGNAPATWSIDFKGHPTATDEVGRVEYWVEAFDPAGNNVTGTRTVNLTVNDTVPAEVRFLRAEPPIVGVGQPMRVVAEVWENAGIEEVRAFLSRINPDSSFTLLGEGVARPRTVGANGTGEWEVETGRDVDVRNLTAGTYLWTIRPIDKNRNVTCAQPDGRLACRQADILVRVSLDAGIQIQLDSPPRGATVVNATPTIQFTVFERNVTASGITLRAGNSTANLTTVAPTSVTDLVIGGTRAGAVVTYRPNLTDATFAVQLVATSQGVTNSTSVLTFAVDPVAPVVNATVTGTVDVGGRAYAGPATRVNLTTDGPATITYTLNEGSGVLTYSSTLTPTLPPGTEGEWRLDYRATDAAGNAARGTIRLPYDAKEPVINVSKHGDDLLVAVTDGGVGVNESSVRVFYKYGNASSFAVAPLQKQAGNAYRAQLPGNATATGLQYYFEARDLLGNTGTRHSAAQPYVIEPEGAPDDLPPTLRITSPLPDANVRDEVTLRWLAEDPEGANLTITIALRTPTRGDRFIQTAGPNNGTYVVDLRGAAPGTHTLVVTASDGEKTAQESVSFLVLRGDLVEVITPPPVRVEEDRLLAFAVRVNPGSKAVSNVTYVLVRDNGTVASGGMKLAQDAYSANIVPDAPGKYAVLVTVAYADGTSEPPRQVAAFEVAGREATTSGAGLPPSLLTLVVLALATIALSAYAAFVRWPR